MRRKTVTIAITATIMLTAARFLDAQRPGPPRVIATEDLPTAVDTAVVARSLERLAAGIARIALRYPQLADWHTPRGEAWEDAGTRRTRTELEYGHSLTAMRNAGYNGRFGLNGFHLQVTVYSQRAFVGLSGPTVGNITFGAPVGGGCAVATVYSAHPRAPDVEAAVADVIRNSLATETGCTTPLDDAGYIAIARTVSTATLASTEADSPFVRWLADRARVDTSTIEWEVNDCGGGGDGLASPTCVSGTAWLGGDTVALFTLIVADLKGAPGTPAVRSLHIKTGSTDIEFKTLAEWAAAVARRR